MPDYDRAIGSRPGIICGDRTCLIRPGLLWRASIALFCLFTATPGFGQNLPTTADVEIATVTVIQAQEIVSRATLEAVRWSGPESGRKSCAARASPLSQKICATEALSVSRKALARQPRRWAGR
jgi:hypothetical protein